MGNSVEVCYTVMSLLLLNVNSDASMITAYKENTRQQSCFAKNLYGLRAYCRQIACRLAECLSDHHQERALTSIIIPIFIHCMQ